MIPIMATTTAVDPERDRLLEGDEEQLHRGGMLADGRRLGRPEHAAMRPARRCSAARPGDPPTMRPP